MTAAGADADLLDARALACLRSLARLRAEGCTAESLVAFLGDPCGIVRQAAVGVLVLAGPTSTTAATLLSTALVATGEPLRQACAQALGRLGAPMVPTIVERLGAGSAPLRARAVALLGECRSDDALAPLAAHLEDPAGEVRVAAARALGSLGGERAVSALRSLLGRASTDSELLAAVVGALEQAGAVLSYDELAPHLARRRLASAEGMLLARCGDARAVGQLVAWVEGCSGDVLGAAAMALGQLAREPSVDVGNELRRALRASAVAQARLTGLLEDSSDEVAEAAALSLARLGDGKLAPRVLAAWANRASVEPGLRAVTAMGACAVRPLLDGLEGVGLDARVLFLEAIAWLGEDAPMSELLEAASWLDERSSEAALRAVGSLGGEKAIPALMDFVRAADAGLSGHAAAALASIAASHEGEVGRYVRQALAGGDVRPEWFEVLGVVAGPEDLALLGLGVEHADPLVRSAAVSACAALAEGASATLLTRACRDEMPEVRAAAARALRGCRAPQSTAVLVDLARDPEPTVAAAALGAVRVMSDERVSSVLLDAVGSAQAPRAIAALQAILRENPPNAAEAVASGMAHHDPEVVAEAVELTVRLPDNQAGAVLISALRHSDWDVRRRAARALVGRNMPVDLETLLACLAGESEPLVRGELAGLALAAVVR